MPTKLNWQAAYFFMLAVYFKTYWELWVVALSRLSHTRVSHPLLPAVLLCIKTHYYNIIICFNTPSPECLNGPTWILSLDLLFYHALESSFVLWGAWNLVNQYSLIWEVSVWLDHLHWLLWENLNSAAFQRKLCLLA